MRLQINSIDIDFHNLCEKSKHISLLQNVMHVSEGRFDLSTFRSERTNEASTLTITPKRSSSRDVDRFSVHPGSRHILIWRECGTRNNPAFVHENVKFGGGGVMVYTTISIDGCTVLHIIWNGALIGCRYRNEILRAIVVPYAAAIGDDFMLMYENCRPYRTNLVDDFLFEEGIIGLE
ncbi:transposable element Tcb2 transposase [Trichonephila clavipes]|nr:transposable element Tcb2 transposase [Trichonephila clavipes]